MKTYIKFIITIFFKSFLFVSSIFLSLVLILNILTEIEFFKDLNVEAYLPIYVSFLNSPDLLFEMFPFIFLVSTQVFFINILKENQIQIFKYSGLKNTKILQILGLTSFITGLIIIILFYSLSSNLKNIYFKIKNKYTTDDKYLAVITNNGLWIKDTFNNKINIVHAKKMNNNYLNEAFITQFDSEYTVLRHIQSNNVNIQNKEWVLIDAQIYENNISNKVNFFKIKTNFDYEKIQSLFSNLSSLTIVELVKLRENYSSLNYSTIDVDIQLHKIISYPFYLFTMTFLSALIMFNTKRFASRTIKISIGLFCSVVIYYIYNFFIVMGQTEKLSVEISVWSPILILIISNVLFSYKLNEK
tara:strand:- start:205 stop:1278 length:1074 start_codon:yes stop_codon:yes gene_type:complete